jgi:hypothetical protein
MHMTFTYVLISIPAVSFEPIGSRRRLAFPFAVVLLLLGAAGSVDEVLKFAAGFSMGKQKKTRQFAQVCCVSCARAAVETSKPAGRTRVVDSCAGETDDQPQGLQAVRKR